MSHDEFKNDALSAELYEAALNQMQFFDYSWDYLKLSRWQRFKAWWYWRLPRVHFGPCDHENCE